MTQAYVPGKSPFNTADPLRAYLEQEFRAIARAFNTPARPAYPRTVAEQNAGVDVDETLPYGCILRFYCPTDGASDCAPAIDAALSCIPNDLVNGQRLYFPAIGTNYRLLTQPQPIIQRVWIHGDGMGSQLLRDYDGATSADGIFNVRHPAQGVRIENFSFLIANGRSGGCHVSDVASAGGGATSFLRLRNLRCTAETNGSPGGTSDYDIYIDGAPNPGPGALGVRAPHIESCDLFGGQLGAFFARSTVAMRCVGVNTYDAGGVPGTVGTVHITGDATTNSFYPYFSAGVIHGLALDYTEKATIIFGECSGDVTNTANVKETVVIGHVALTVQSNWVDSTYYPN